MNYIKLAGENISSLVAYKPGKPIDKLKREFGLNHIIKLASNENPLGPSPKVVAAIQKELPEISRYPLGDAYNLRMAVSRELNIPADELLFGAGSNEIIELLLRTFVKHDEHVISPSPSFSVYGIISQAMGSRCEWVPTGARFEIDLDAVLKKVNNKTRAIFLANPNNPTGTYANKSQLKAFLDKLPKDVIVVMDEAYVEFSDAADMPDTLKMYKEYPNIVSMRTFSKAYGVAGLRIGYCVAHKDCCDMMNRVRQPFNTNMLAQVAAVVAIEDGGWLKEVINNNRQGKEYIYAEFKKLSLDYIPTQANFILVNVGNGEKVFNDLLRKGVIVRYMGQTLASYVRVSIGTKEENEFFIKSLQEVL